MDNGLKEFELLLKKYTRLLNKLDPKHKNSQVTGEAYNMIIQDAKKGIARAKSRNENSGLHLQRVSVSLPTEQECSKWAEEAANIYPPEQWTDGYEQGYERGMEVVIKHVKKTIRRQ